MPKDQPHLHAELKIVNNHPRMRTTNTQMRADHIRLFVKNSWTVFPHPKGG